MRALLELVVRGRIPATLIAAGCASISLIPLLWPFGYVSGAVLGLVTLRYGLYEGLFVLVSASVVFSVFSTFLIENVMQARFDFPGAMMWAVVTMLLLSWVWTWVMAAALRGANAQGFALLVGGLVGILAILGFPLFVADSTLWWLGPIDQLVEGLSGPNLAADPQAVMQTGELLHQIAPVMTGLVVAGAMFNAIIMLLISRWWHATMDNPGGFAREFRGLRLDRRISIASVALVLVIAYAGDVISNLGLEILGVAMVLFVFQGLALIHALVAATGVWSGWLLVMYVMVVLAAPQLLFILAATGFLDTWFDFRKRVHTRTT